MRRADELGQFLRSRRARVEPEMVGLPPGDRRRVEGLRREELAHLANLSVDYLVRLEQGRVERPSPEIVEALARSLLLDPSERRHLYRLAAASEPTAGHGDGNLVRGGIRLLIDTLDRTPGVLLSRRLDLLYWNPTAEALLGPFADHRNYARMILLDPAQRTLHADWEEAARQAAALLRYAAARHPEDDRLRALVAELADADPRFSLWWDAHDVEEKRHGAKTYRHPTAGELTLTYEAFPLPDDGDQILTVYTVEPGTVDAERLAGLYARLMSPTDGGSSRVIFLPPGDGRSYQAGPMRAVFKADGAETEDRYCISEWWLEAGDSGPGPHSHEGNVEIFYVIEGTMSFLADDTWLDAPRGSFLRIPPGVTHDFENRSTERAGALNVFMPGGFEVKMPAIVDYFATQSDSQAREE